MPDIPTSESVTPISSVDDPSSRPYRPHASFYATHSRVPTPEPHLPLRKASPDRLRTRHALPHPLFITSQNGSQGFKPATGATTAEPYHTPVTAGLGKDGHLEAPQDGEKLSFETVVPRDYRGSRKESWPLAAGGVEGDNHSISSSRKGSKPKLRASRSMTDGFKGIRDRLTKHRGQDRPMSPEFGHGPSFPDMAADDVRTSFRSALTSNSSFMDSTIDTERSSMATGNSSSSDFVKVYPAWPETDEDLTVEDAIGMYAEGFETPSRQSLDLSHERHSLSLRPSSSPLVGPSKDRSHRRSRSASMFEKLQKTDDMNANLAPPRSTHVRTSTQIMTGRDMPGGLQASPSADLSIKSIPRDRYGFKKISHHVSLEQFNTWESPYNEHLERRKCKWMSLMKQYGLGTEQPVRFPPRSDKVKRYVRKGVPPDWRGAAWFWYAGGPGLQKKYEGLYYKLLGSIKRGGALSDNDKEHIERDLNRTFPDNIRFKPDPVLSPAINGKTPRESAEPETNIVRSLRRVLQAFAVHNPGIGYCQSLNFIAGLLLLFLDEDEEKSFILLNVVCTEHLPGTHGVSLEGANIDIAVLMTSVREALPAIWVKIDDKPANAIAGGPPALPTVSLATTAWFMSLFVGTLPIECVLRVWDCLFFEGSKTLFRIALAIFKAGEAQIRAVNDPMEIFQVVQSMPRGMVDANALMEVCFKRRNGFGTLTQDVVEKRRQERRAEIKQGRSMTNDMPRKKGLGSVMSKGRFRSKTKGAG